MTPKLSELELWNNAASEYDALIKRGDFLRQNLLNPELQKLIEPARGKKILDAGCGQGYFLDWLSKSGGQVTGLDGSSRLIELAQKNYPEYGDGLMVADLKERLPFNNESFDGVVANMVLMDFDPISGAIREFSRILKPGGFFTFSILHPIFSSGDLKKNLLEKITYTVPHYETKTYKSRVMRPWQIHGLTKPTVIYHRPLEFYFDLLKESEFQIVQIKEPTLDKNTQYQNNFYELCKELPLFLIANAIKN